MRQLIALSFAVIGFSIDSVGIAADKLQASAGTPLGVGSWSVDLGQKTKYIPDVRTFVLTEAKGRALYPVFSSDGQILMSIRNLKSQTLTVHFLFRGNQPLKLRLQVRDGKTFDKTITPVKNVNQALLKDWWNLYSKRADFIVRNHKYPQVVDNYLISMLGRRLGFKIPKFRHRWSSYNEYDAIIGTFLGTESIRGAIQRDTFLKNTRRTQPANMGLPTAVTPPPVTLPKIPDDVAIESIAMRVPADCFYIRCGTYTNFRWLRSNIDVWGSRIRDVVETQAQDYRVQQNLERQLALKETTLAVVFGDSIVSDIAVIGADTFLREGASVGVLFETNGDVQLQVLKDQLKKLRDESLIKNPEAKSAIQNIDNHDVIALTSPDNRVRSFTVIDRKYVLVTNSRTIARDFLRTRDIKTSLGKLFEFRHIRNLMPMSRNDTCFVYLSDPFFRRIVSPQYRVEMTRRMQADAEIELTHVARLAAKAEEQPCDSIDDLVDGGFVPSNFAVRPDGSRTLINDGHVIDSHRGARGSLVPVADVEGERITQSEHEAYQKFASMYRRLWRRMDPAAVAIKRTPIANGREKVVFDVHITPYLRRDLGIVVTLLAPPSKQRIKKIDGDLFSIQALINANFLGSKPSKNPPYKAFAAYHEYEIDFKVENGAVSHVDPISEEFFYLGSTPPLHILTPSLGKITPDPDGYASLKKTGWPFRSGHWVRIWDKFRVHSPRLDLLKRVTPKIELEEAERAAQVRVRIGDLAETGVAGFANAHGYINSRMISGTNVEFLNRLMGQLNVPAETALDEAEAILAARLICPLKGSYELPKNTAELKEWRSTAWETQAQSEVNSIPDGYRYPLLDWMHGLELEFSADATTLNARMELRVDPSAMDHKSGNRFSLK